ncbi:hypothetical protein [Saccharopolyspora spinosa]|uniref:hypothetical protein n=1 Tax=Saccharopolyspora spinosa TaxID=60894 RepID=UPI0002379560|nr:hypothetical protein [Saccharopolyspora spinosa]
MGGTGNEPAETLRGEFLAQLRLGVDRTALGWLIACTPGRHRRVLGEFEHPDRFQRLVTAFGVTTVSPDNTVGGCLGIHRVALAAAPAHRPVRPVHLDYIHTGRTQEASQPGHNEEDPAVGL